MSRLRLWLLGPFRATLDGQPVYGFESGKVRALLSYLAAQPGCPQQRDKLVGLLWPEQPERAARNNLRQALANLRLAIGDRNADPPFLLITRATIGFNPASEIWIDIAEMRALLAKAERHSHRRPETCRSCAGWLQAAADLYQDEFLAHLHIADSPAFEEWVLLQREAAHRQTVAVLDRLATYHTLRGRHDLSLRYAMRQLALEPWREEAHRQAMRGLAMQGQRSAALAEYEVCRRVLASELGAEPSRETQALYRQLKDADWSGNPGAPLAPAIPQPGGEPGAAPAMPLTPIIGRDEELARIGQLLEDPACRLLTLVGPGGAGKTRLALEAAAHYGVEFVGGARIVLLAAVNSAESLKLAIAQALGFAFHGAESLDHQLLSHLRSQDLLLVLDNFEHLLDEAPFLEQICRAAPLVTLLVTSCLPLHLAREVVYEVNGLPIDGAEAAQEGSGQSSPAVALFVRQASRADARFELSANDLPDIARICRLVDGLPLAIELAAGWVRSLTCREIADEIERDWRFLASRAVDVPARHRSLEFVFDRSWSLLSKEEQGALEALSVFRGGFERRAAEQVAGLTLPLLDALAGKSLVRRGTAGRYDLHDLLRQYAARRLNRRPEQAQAVECRHTLHFTAQLSGRIIDLQTDKQQNALAWIRGEIENLREAWRRHIVGGGADDASWPFARLWLVFDILGWFHRGEALFGWMADELQTRLGPGGGSPEADTMRGAVLAQWGWFCLRLGKYEQARALLQRCRALGRQSQTAGEPADLPYFTGVLAWLVGDYGDAERALRRGLAVHRERGDRWGMALVLGQLGLVAQAAGDYAAAKRLLLESLDLFRALGDRWMAALSLSYLSTALRALGDTGEAQEVLRESLAISKATGSVWSIPIALHHLGAVAYTRGDYERARQLQQESLALFTEIGDRGQQAVALCHLGYAACALGQCAEAERCFRQGLELATAIHAVPAQIDNLVGLAKPLSHGSEADRGLAAKLLMAVCEHRASSQEARDRAARLLLETGQSCTGLPPPGGSEAMLPSLDDLAAAILAPHPAS